MSNDWLRLWHEMPNDPKWRTIARLSKQAITAVISVYVHLLVCASTASDRGRPQSFDSEDVANALDLETDQVIAILSAMEGKVIIDGKLKGWEKRQPSRGDEGSAKTGAKSAAERKREQRQREKEGREKSLCHECHECHEKRDMSRNGHEMVTNDRDINSQKSEKNSSQITDIQQLSRMSRNVTTDKDKDTDKDKKYIDDDCSAGASKKTIIEKNQVSEIYNWAMDLFQPASPLTSAPIMAWLEWGADVELDIKPVAELYKRKHDRRPPRSLSWLDEAIARSIQQRNRPMPEIAENKKTGRSGNGQREKTVSSMPNTERYKVLKSMLSKGGDRFVSDLDMVFIAEFEKLNDIGQYEKIPKSLDA